MDLYLVLGLSRDATLDDIKRAYRRLARRYHPDINPGDREAEAHYNQIAEAFETLSDPDRRQQYDAGGTATASPAAESRTTVGFEGFDFSISVSGPQAPTFGDLFSEVWTDRAARAHGPERGADIHLALRIPFAVAIGGGQRLVTFTRQATCLTCGGAGVVRASWRDCQHCQGTGALRSTRGHMIFTRPCLTCRGAGRLPESWCPACGGQQREMRTETMTVQVVPGIADGSCLHIPAQGHAGRNGGEPGDLQLTIEIEPHPLFTRHGDDLHLVLPVAVHEAALGARIDVPTLDEPVKLRVPPGTQSGQRFRLRERGAPSARDGHRGDLIVEVRLVLPRVLDERSKELLREFGRLHADDVRKDLMPL